VGKEAITMLYREIPERKYLGRTNFGLFGDQPLIAGSRISI